MTQTQGNQEQEQSGHRHRGINTSPLLSLGTLPGVTFIYFLNLFISTSFQRGLWNDCRLQSEDHKDAGDRIHPKYKGGRFAWRGTWVLRGVCYSKEQVEAGVKLREKPGWGPRGVRKEPKELLELGCDPHRSSPEAHIHCGQQQFTRCLPGQGVAAQCWILPDRAGSSAVGHLRATVGDIPPRFQVHKETWQ